VDEGVRRHQRQGDEDRPPEAKLPVAFPRVFLIAQKRFGAPRLQFPRALYLSTVIRISVFSRYCSKAHFQEALFRAFSMERELAAVLL